MAINVSTNSSMVGRHTPPDGNYPYGSSQDETAVGANDGTPYFKARADDLFGIQQALLIISGIVPSGNADRVGASQYLQALVEVGAGRASFAIESGGSAADVYVVEEVATSEAPQSFFDGMRILFRPAATNTATTVTIDAFGLGVRGIKNKGGGDLFAGQLSTVLLNELEYDDVASVFRFREVDFAHDFSESLVGDLFDVTDGAAIGQILKKQADGSWAPEDDTSGGVPSTTFKTLTDTDNSYTGKAGAIQAVNSGETGITAVDQVFSAGDLSEIVFPNAALLAGAVANGRNDGIIVPVGSTGVATQNNYEIPIYALPLDTRVKFTMGLVSSVDFDTQTPFSLTVFFRLNDGTTVSSGITKSLTKLSPTTWEATGEFTLQGDERAIEFLFIIDGGAVARSTVGTLSYVSSSFIIISTSDPATGSEQTVAYRENVQTNLNIRLFNENDNETAADGSRDFSSVRSAVDALGAGINVNLGNEARIFAGDYLGEVSASDDIDPANFCNIISRLREEDVVIDGRQAASTPDQDLIENIFLKHSSHIKGLTLLAENSRYPFHLESGNSNDRAQQLIEDVTATHFGADIWASPTAFGIGHHDGQKQVFKRVTGLSYTAGALSFHDNIDWIYGVEMVVEDSQFWTGDTDNTVLSCSSVGSGLMSLATFRNCSINGTLKMNNSGWLSAKLENQPANRWSYKVVFDNCGPFDWYAPNDDAKAFILQSLNVAGSEIVLSGDAVPVLFGDRADIRAGGVGLPAKAFSRHAITTDGPDPGVELEARLGDRSGGSALTLTVAFDGDAPINVAVDQDYTGLSNAAVIALLQTALDTAQGGSTARVFAENLGEWRNNAPIFQPSREGIALNADVTAILKGHTVAYEDRDVVLMTNAMGPERFAGIALKNAVIGDPVRFQSSGWINEVMLRGLAGTPSLYDTLEVGATAGELLVGTTDPILRLRSEQTFGDTYEFIGRET